MEPVSNGIREKTIVHKQNKVKESDIAKRLIISKSTVTKVWARYRKTGCYLPSPKIQGRKSAIDAETMVYLVMNKKLYSTSFHLYQKSF